MSKPRPIPLHQAMLADGYCRGDWLHADDQLWCAKHIGNFTGFTVRGAQQWLRSHYFKSKAHAIDRLDYRAKHYFDAQGVEHSTSRLISRGRGRPRRFMLKP